MKLRTLTRDPLFPSQYGEQHPLSSSDLDDFENTLGVGLKLPMSYKAFMGSYNGGLFNECILPDTKLGTLVACGFLHISSSDENSVNRQLPFFEEEIGRGFIPIASDPGGNYFLLGCAANQSDAVFFWLHDRCDESGNRLVKIADSFSDFLNSLRVDD